MHMPFSFQFLPQDCNLHLEDLTTLVVHVVTSTALLDIFDYDEELMCSNWEQGFAHPLTNLKQLKVVFILPGKTFEQSSNHMNKQGSWMNLRCEDCTADKRDVKFSFQYML